MKRSPIVATLWGFALAGAVLLAGCGGGEADSGVSTFSKSYGGPLHDEARVVLATDDGGFMLLGSADADALGTASSLQPGIGAPQGGDFWLQKLDANGNVEHSRTIGLRAPAVPGTAWKRARPTADGGVVLAGTHAITQPIRRPDGSTSVVITDRDLAVTRLDATGNVLWSVSHGSGAWVNYDYFERNGHAAVAHDWAEDVWPMADGGVLVAGTSTANLEDRLGIGFPCDDEELNPLVTDHHGFETCGGGQGGSRFVDAYSVVVMRLNADGSLRWVRRLTDLPYDSRGNARPDGIGVLVRSTADGGVVLSRSVGRDSALVRRLAADGSPLWRTLLRRVLAPTFNISTPPVDLIQTDDPVDGRDADQYDRERDDGFVLATRHRVVKLNSGGAVQWNSELALERAAPDSQRHLNIHGLAQHCDYGRPPRCDVVAVGGLQKQNAPGSSGPSGFVAFLDQDGDVRAEAYAPDDLWGSRIRSFLRIAAGSSGRFELLGISGGNLALIELDAASTEPTFMNERSGTSQERKEGTPELRPDGSVLLLEASGQYLHFFDSQARARSELNVGAVNASDVLRAGVQIGPGRFVLAGTRRAPNAQSGIVALRYDLDADGARVVWQRRLVDDEGGDLLAAAASGDGGVVLSLFTAVPSDPQRAARLIKLDADGDRQWDVGLPGPATELRRMPDGGFAALSSSFEDSVLRITRVSAAGLRQWQKSVSLGAEQGVVQAFTPTADGGLMLAGSMGTRISLVRLASDGELVSARDVELPAERGRDVYFDDLQIRQSADGGFVIAMTEHGLLTQVSEAGSLLAYGQSNILVLKLDAAGGPLWSRVYGGRFNEGVRDLALRGDGTIAVAGYSDSLGDRREAWLLKLSPQGLISEGGCQALLGSVAPALMSTGTREATVLDSATAVSVGELPRSEATDAPLSTPQDFITARQCLGDAGAGGPDGPALARRRLSVLQVGSHRGVVTSTPAGISCATGLDVCTAEFVQGGRVSLRADPTRFVAWRGDCDEGSGGTALECVIVLTQDRSIQVEFGSPPPPPPPRLFAISFAVQGGGFVNADGGIRCGEASPAADCWRDYAEGSVVNASAEPGPGEVFLGWSGETAESVCRSFGRRTNVQITVDRNLRCFAQFGPG